MSDLIGRVLCRRYRVDAFLGRGGMAEVYKAWDQRRSVYVAIKLLREDMAEDIVFLRRFRREAQTLERLQHPSIVRFYGMEEDGPLVFLVMDYIEGGTLRKEIRAQGGPLPLGRILKVMRSVCSALHYAHLEGQVHCDVKPANIMLGSKGEVYLSDFGIARRAEGATTATMAGVGAPAYMAPEQIREEDPCPQTDIYALGIVLYEMLTGGERPFNGEQAEITGTTGEKLRWEQRNLPPPSPRRFNPKISPELEAVVLKCLEKDPGRRFTSALAQLEALEHSCQAENQVLPSQLKVAEESNWKPFDPRSSQPLHDKHVLPDPKPAEKDKRRRRRAGTNGFIGITSLAMIALLAAGGLWTLFEKFQYTQKTVDPMEPIINASKIYTQAALTVEAGQEQTKESVLQAGSERVSSVDPMEPTINASKIYTQVTLTVEAGQEQTKESVLQAGSERVSSKDGMLLVYVPEGEFLMGSSDSDGQAGDDEKPQHPVYLDAFWIDQTEVTNAQYAKCVADGKCTPPNESSSYTLGSYYDNPQYADYPVIYVDWNQASAYCAWAGRRLPSEAEWEKAARGTDGRSYPWGNGSPSCDQENFGGTDGCVGDTNAVGSYPDGTSPSGALDMAGNVWEWVGDWYSETYYQHAPQRNPTGPANGEYRVLRGGSWDFKNRDTRSALRGRFHPGVLGISIGFRCACSP